MSDDTIEPPLSEQKTRRMLPGEDCPDCVFCGHGLHEARPTLVDVLDAVSFDKSISLLVGKIAVDCPTCGKPNEVCWHIDFDDSTWSAESHSLWTKADQKYAWFFKSAPQATVIPADLGAQKSDGVKT